MRLTELLSGIIEVANDREISGLALDSRKVKPGYLFIALDGSLQHGMEYVDQALANGAAAVIYDPLGKGQKLAEAVSGVGLFALSGLTESVGEIAAKFFGKPSLNLEVFGVTGTNGKTTCSQFLAQAFDDCGVIGTMGWGVWGSLKDTVNTTPDAVSIQSMLSDFVSQEEKKVVMEVSSHGLQQGRVNGVAFKGALFTNLSRDHLDYHGDMEQYLAAKLKLFKCPDLSFAVLNLDDGSLETLLSHISDTVKIWGFTTQEVIDSDINSVSAKNIQNSLEGIQFDVCWKEQIRTVKTKLVGSYNLENLLAVITVMLATEMPLDFVMQRIAALKPVAGRMENFGGHGKPVVFVDYAHSPDALNKVLSGLKPYCQKQLKVVFGCGGERDKGKRAQMGIIAEDWADEVILTDDNPRGEEPETIIKDILSARISNKVAVIHDRKQAIKTVINNAESGDCIVIAGKGHESYQEIKGVRLSFSDQKIVRQALQEWVG